MFKDEAIITFQAGQGGSGCLSFYRAKFVPRGGPDGGDGGKGGDIWMQADSSLSSLHSYAQVRNYKAKGGKAGMPNNKTGKNGEDLILKVPVGTILRDPETKEIICDLVEPRQKFLVAHGGKGGRGNQYFATAINQTPRTIEEGKLGEEGKLFLELKLIADIGIVGLPNAGKSTFLSSVTNAHPKIGAYPFTTLTPQLGFVELDADNRILFADIPGLIEGAHEGVGLGDQFLRHIERTRILLHLVDISEMNDKAPADSYNIIRKELENFSPVLIEKKEVVVATKSDLNPDVAGLKELEECCGSKVFFISAVAHFQMEPLLLHLHRLLNEVKETESAGSS